MQVANFKKLNLFFIFLFIGQFAFSQLSTTHYIPPLTSSVFGNANPQDQYIYLSTPSKTDVAYTIKPIGQPDFSFITGIVSNTNPQEISIGSGNGQLFIASTETSTVIKDKGYIIESDAPIYVSVRMNAGGAQAGALVSKGLSALGNTFRVGSFTNQNPQDNYLNFVSVMATEDNTKVTFDKLPAGLVIKNYSGTTPVNTILSRGESYTIATNSFDSTINQDGLIGCLITSNKPVVVNCGSANGSFGNGGGRDYGIDQIVDLSKVGTEYIFVRGDGSNDWENVLLVPHTPGTTFSINNGPTTPIRFPYQIIEGDKYNSGGNLYVKTSEPVFAYQGVGGLDNNNNPNEANQGLFFVPPLSCEARGNLDNIANINNIGNTNYSGGITVVTKVSATVTINNNPINATANLVNGKPEYVTYKVKGLNGNISVQSTDELYCAYFNYNGAATSGSFYSGFPSRPEINFNPQFATLGNCISNVTLEAANAKSFDSFEWFYDNGSGFQSVPSSLNKTSIIPTIPAKYKLIGTITCTGETLESAEVPLSICPDDIDNDGIIDNLDIDNDNDGILNCTESKGDVQLNLSNLNIPELIFQDSTKDNSIITGIYTQSNTSGNSNTFNGNSSGGFTSILADGTNAENIYSISSTELINIKLQETTSLPINNIDGEFFIARILPADKNITLVDSNNHLLVDSNFDGVFESGITQISGSEIHFKVNPNPTGDIPYQFSANQVDGFSFTHKLVNGTDSSIFTGSLSLTCYKKDNDLDGIKDELDLDSDNDGIPDFIENQGILVQLQGTDSNNDGLDDVYDITNTPIDTDNDGVLDFYDLDSDNDGIHDLMETGQLGITLFDTNLDGVENGLNNGVNGWADTAETSPDSNLMGYSLNDLDADTIFSYIDSDSDGDLCSDVIEAGFSDVNGDTYLGDNIVTTNASGLVNNANDGYTIPYSDYSDIAPLSMTTPPMNTVICEVSAGNISVISPEAETFQWEVSVDDGINWNIIIDDAIYNGTQTSILNLTNTPLSFSGYKYRIKLDKVGNACGIYSNEITLTVNPLPIVNSSVILVQCDDDDSSTLGFSPFNLTEANNELSANAANEQFSYFLSQSAANTGDTTSPDYIRDPTTFLNRTISTDNVWTRIESQSGCVSTTEIQLNVSTTVVPPSFLVTFNQCDDDLDVDGNDNINNDDEDGIASFDFSSVTPTILSFIPAGQNPQPPRYFRNETDALAEINEITDISNYRNIGYPGSQYIYVRVDSNITNDCLGLGAHVLLNVESLPTFEVETPRIVCTSDPTFSILLSPLETNGFEKFDYEWLWTSIDGSSSNQFISNDKDITISTPGTYTITLTKKDGANCSKTKEIFVDTSELATITDNDVTIKDLSQNNSVTIDTTNLGSGNYVYALKEENSNFLNYQGDPYFDNVFPGFYTIHVKDEICGVATLDIPVIGHPKFFTPNGDGYNDYWQIKGINANNQPNSTILIYDRYGKLLKQLLVQSKGWDGTLNGSNLPNDDYWFKLVLEDGRDFSGHFTLKR